MQSSQIIHGLDPHREGWGTKSVPEICVEIGGTLC